MVFKDRSEAGRLLATRLAAFVKRPDVRVLALPRGGVPVAFEVAQALNAPLDVFVVRKLGLPGHEELATGAIACAASTRAPVRHMSRKAFMRTHTVCVNVKQRAALTAPPRLKAGRTAVGNGHGALSFQIPWQQDAMTVRAIISGAFNG